MVRLISCGILISLQIVLFIVLVVTIGKKFLSLDNNQLDPFLYYKLIPMTVVYGSTLLITVIIDSYWTVEVYHFAKEGRKLIKKNL
jgi:hypothetical protein